MPNNQHAWASLTDTCTGSKTSPDLAPEAASCARTESAAVMNAFVTEIRTAGLSPSRIVGQALFAQLRDLRFFVDRSLARR
jgi:hypothetical protein